MAPLQLFFLLFSIFAYGLAWFLGGPPERRATGVLIIGTLASGLTQPLMIGQFHAGDAVVDGLILTAFGVLAVRYDRWWLLAATAFLILTLTAHASMLIFSDLDARGDVAARWGLGIMVITCLALGVFERWLAGEPAGRPRQGA